MPAMIRSRSLKFQLSAVFLSFFSLLLFLGLFSLAELSDVNAASVELRAHWLESTRVLGDLNNYTSDYRAAEATHLQADTDQLIAMTDGEIAKLEQVIELAQKAYLSIPHDPGEQQLYARFAEHWLAYKAIAAQVLALSRQGDKIASSSLYKGASKVAYDKASDTLGALTDRTVAGAAKAGESASVTYNYARTLIAAALFVALLAVVGVLQYINRSISRPLLELAANMRLLASDVMDITIRNTARSDEIGAMARSVVVFRKNAMELARSQQGLRQQAVMLEEKLQYEQRLATMQRNFLSMASHEFRTPLTIIDGHAQRMLKLKTTLTPEQLGERVQKIRSAVLRMTSVMENLLTSSRLLDSAPDLYFHPAPFDLGRMLHEVCHLHREIAAEAQIFERPGELPEDHVGDRHLLFQAVSNLISNAVKYSPDGGLIAVRSDVDRQCIRITVADQGIGIPEGDLPQLFERYHRGSNVSGIAGTGIGLYLVKMVAALHGGSIAVTSSEGRGSEFVLSLPLTGA